MNDIKNVTDKILSDARAFAEETAKNAAERAEKILASYREKADKINAVAVEKAHIDAERAVTRAVSAQKLRERNLLLAAKRETADAVLGEAAKQLVNLPMDEYVALLLGFLKSVCEARDGIICLNEKDLNSVGTRFLRQARELYADKFPNCTVELSPTPAKIDGGFILKCGGVEFNCSVSNVLGNFAEKHENDIFKLLFD